MTRLATLPKPHGTQPTRWASASRLNGKREPVECWPLRIAAPARVLNLAGLRLTTREALRQADVRLSDVRLDDLLLILNELATNAIRHAGPGLITIVITIHPTDVSVRVYDRRHKRPVMRRMNPEDFSGRGLPTVNALTCGAWGHRHTLRGKYVWARVAFEFDRSGLLEES
jgi:two-component sensor histidine kinase